MNYRLRITVLSPLHIGSGDTLLRGYDFVTGTDRTWVLNQEAILAAEYEAHGGVVNWQQLCRPPGTLVDPSRLRPNSPEVRYGLEGTTTVDQVREQVKDPLGRCYLPGSSLKGALRSALFAHAVRSGAFRPDLRRLGERREWAGQPWERAVFGRDPNHDLLRALVISDSAPLPTAPSPLMLLHAQVFAAGPPGSPIVVEAVRRGTVFETTLRLDEYLFSAQAGELGFGSRRDWLERLPQIVNDYSRARMEIERRFLTGRRELAGAARFYDELLARRLPEGAFVLQMSWGAGWTGKSVGPWLPKDMQDEIRLRFRLGQPPRFQGGWQPDRIRRQDAFAHGRADFFQGWQPDLTKPFPKTRRLRSLRVQGQVVADVPLGWVQVEMQPEVRR